MLRGLPNAKALINIKVIFLTIKFDFAKHFTKIDHREEIEAFFLANISLSITLDHS